MEDQRKHITQTTHHGDEKIVDLTKRMELPDQQGGNIINLTTRVDNPDAPPAEAVEPPPAEESVQDPQTKDSPGMIEDQVDAAFDDVQEDPPQETHENTPDDQLFDKLSGITEMVDNVVLEDGAPLAIEAKAQVPKPNIADDTSLADDAAVFEAAMENDSEEEDVLELTDVADLKEEVTDPPDDHEIIELTDIVDPADLAHLHATESQGEEVLELTDIVSPDAPHPDISMTPQVPERREPTAAETAEIADLFLEEMVVDEPELDGHDVLPLEQAAAPHPPGISDPVEEQEQVIQLSDVLGQTVRDKRLPIEKIRLGAEEDLAAQPISLDREDTANALGLDLGQPAAEGEDPTRDQEIEDAVEHLLQTKYAKTLERLIASAVEKAMHQKNGDS